MIAPIAPGRVTVPGHDPSLGGEGWGPLSDLGVDQFAKAEIDHGSARVTADCQQLVDDPSQTLHLLLSHGRLGANGGQVVEGRDLFDS